MARETIDHPFARIRQYIIPEGKDIRVDTLAMMEDVVLVFKLGGLPKEALHQAVDETWDTIHVEVRIPKTGVSS